MPLRTLLAATGAATLLFAAGSANAALVFVSSWDAVGGPADYGPLSGQEAAALLFGGEASDYVISTAGVSAAAIDFQAWYLGEAIPGSIFINAHDATELLGGSLTAYGYDPDVSAGRFINYAFREGVGGAAPEPATWALMIGGFGLAGAGLRRHRAARA